MVKAKSFKNLAPKKDFRFSQYKIEPHALERIKERFAYVKDIYSISSLIRASALYKVEGDRKIYRYKNIEIVTRNHLVITVIDKSTRD